MATYVVFRLASLLVALLPPALGYRLATFVADVAFRLCRGRRATVLANLRRALGSDVPEHQLWTYARGVFRTGVKNYYEVLRMPRLRLADLERRVRLHGIEHFDLALAGGRGVILVSAHLGSFESVAQMMAARSYSVIVPAEPIRPQRLFDLMTRLRSSHGLKFVPAQRGVMRQLIKALRRGEIVALALDRDTNGGGLPLEFFGATTTFQTGAVVLARRERCPVLAGFSIRRADNSSDVFVEPPIEMQVTDDEEADLAVNMRRILAVFERYIRAYPDQWVAFVPVWPPNGRLHADRT